LKGVGGGIAVASFASMFGLHDVSAADYNAQAHDAKDTPLTIVSLAATAERLAITSYYNTIKGNPFGLSEAELLYLKYALSSELHHLEVVESFGGKALTDKFYVPAKFLSDFGVNTNTFMAAETAFTGAYLAATRRFAEHVSPPQPPSMPQPKPNTWRSPVSLVAICQIQIPCPPQSTTTFPMQYQRLGLSCKAAQASSAQSITQVLMLCACCLAKTWPSKSHHSRKSSSL